MDGPFFLQFAAAIMILAIPYFIFTKKGRVQAGKALSALPLVFKVLAILLVCVLCVGAGAAIVLSNTPVNPDIVGRNEFKPAAKGTPVSIEDLTIVVTRVWTDVNLSETRIATNARKMLIRVQVTCDLNPGEFCVLKSTRWKLGGISESPFLERSVNPDEIGGGETVEIELSTGFYTYNTSFEGARLEFAMQAGLLGLWRSAYFDLGFQD